MVFAVEVLGILVMVTYAAARYWRYQEMKRAAPAPPVRATGGPVTRHSQPSGPDPILAWSHARVPTR